MKKITNDAEFVYEVLPTRGEKVVVEVRYPSGGKQLTRRLSFKHKAEYKSEDYIRLAKEQIAHEIDTGKINRVTFCKVNKTSICIVSGLVVVAAALSGVLAWRFTLPVTPEPQPEPEPEPVSGISFEISADSTCALKDKDGNKITKLENLKTGDVISGTVTYEGNEIGYHIPHAISGTSGANKIKTSDYTYDPQTGAFAITVKYDNLKLDLKANNAIVSFVYAYKTPDPDFETKTDFLEFVTSDSNIQVDWGDGAKDSLHQHTFPVTSKDGDEYFVNIYSDDLTAFSFNKMMDATNDEPAIMSGFQCVTSVSLYEGIEEIFQDGFRDSLSLKNVYFPESVSAVGSYAFTNCPALTKVNIPAKFDLSGYAIFEDDISITELNISEGIATIGDSCFAGLKNLKSLSIPSTVTYIDDDAFHGCETLTSLFIPKAVSYIGCAAFAGCSGLETITVDEGNESYDNRGNAIVTKVDISGYWDFEQDTLIAGCKNTKITDTTKIIYDDAFCGCTSLTSLNIPSSVIEIYSTAFDGCSSLEAITLNEGLEYIGDYAFFGCKSLKAINIPASVTSIEYGILAGCDGLETVTVDENNEYFISLSNGIITKQETDLFEEGTLIAGCGVTKINENTVKIIGESSFAFLTVSFDIALPNDNTLISIEDWAFEDSIGINNINIPLCIEHVGACAFRNWQRYQKVNLSFTEDEVNGFVEDGYWDPDWNYNNTDHEVVSEAQFIYRVDSRL